MKKIFLSITFFAVLLITPKVYAAGNVKLTANKTVVNIGEEFTVSISLSRGTDCIFNCKSDS